MLCGPLTLERLGTGCQQGGKAQVLVAVTFLSCFGMSPTLCEELCVSH